jgi:hypothetical protein
MKAKLCFSLSEGVVKLLQIAAKQNGANKSAIVEAALESYLGSHNTSHSEEPVLARVNRVSRQLEELDRNIRIVSETVSLHARYQLTVTPPLPHSRHRDACALGQERFEVFAAQVGRRVHLGTPLMRETLDRLSSTDPDLFSAELQPPLASNAQGAVQAPSDTEPNGQDALDGKDGPEQAGRLSPL